MSYFDFRTATVRPEADFDLDTSHFFRGRKHPYEGTLYHGLFWALLIAVSFWVALATLIWIL